MRRTHSDYAHTLLPLAAVDHLLTETAIPTPAIRVAGDGPVPPESSFTRGGSLAGIPLTGLVGPVKLLGRSDNGGTVALQVLQRYWSPVGYLVAALELEIGHPCKANAYFTPPGAQSFAVHSDAHDVSVVQTHGTKIREVHGDGGPGDALREPGIVAYLPIGSPHAARAQKSMLLNLTVGTNKLTWRSLLSRELGRLLSTVAVKHLPAGYLDDTAPLNEGMDHHLAALANAVHQVDPATLAAGQADEFLRARPPRITGTLLDRDAMTHGLTVSTALCRRGAHPCVLTEGRDVVRVLVGDHVGRIPVRRRPALHHLTTHLELRLATSHRPTTRARWPHADVWSARVARGRPMTDSHAPRPA